MTNSIDLCRTVTGCRNETEWAKKKKIKQQISGWYHVWKLPEVKGKG